MPVITRSQANGGLQDQCSAPLPLLRATCSNAITSSSEINHSTISEDSSINLPALVHQTQPSVSSSEYDNNSTSSLDSDFETLKFKNFKLSSSSVHTADNYFELSQFSRMESDYQDSKPPVDSNISSSSNDEIIKMLTALSNCMVTGQQDLQNQLIRNDLKLESELQRIREENLQLRQELRQEFSSSLNMSTNSSSEPTIVRSTPSQPVVSTILNSNTTVPSTSMNDFQTQMLSVLNDTFSKLSSVISDTSNVLQDTKQALTDSKSPESKVDWVKFSGDHKKFRNWYLAIMAQLSIAPWKELYDSDTNSVVKTTSNVGLNGKLYAKVIGSLEGSTLQHMLSRPHLRANGVLLLQELHQMYKPKNVPEVIAAKTVEFWGNMKRLPTETVDDYYNRFHELLEELSEAEEVISTKSATRHFIFTLGTEFEPLQHNYRLGSISEDWKTQDWPTLLVLCRDFYNSVNPKGPMTKRDRDLFSDLQIDRSAHHKKVRQWFMNPTRYCQDIATEQNKYPGKCIYHLSSTHSTTNCNVRKECDKLLSANKPSASSGSTSGVHGQLRHLTEETFEDAIETETKDDPHESNDTNESDLLYFCRVSNHYLRLARSGVSNVCSSRHPGQYPIIIDSGANFHMFKEREFFRDIIPATGKVILGDGKTSIPIQGVGTVECIIGNHTLLLDNVRFVPTLSESIYSLFIHTQLPDHGIFSSFEEGLYLQFPDFRTQAIIGEHDLYLDASPCNPTMLPSTLPFIDDQSRTSCRRITEFQNRVDQETNTIDHLLHQLRLFYQNVKTKRQLNLEVPAGFRKTSLHSQNLKEFHSLNHISSQPVDSDTGISSDILLLPSDNPDSNQDSVMPSHVPTDDLVGQSHHIPIVRSIDKPSSSLPGVIRMSEDYLRSSLGFRRVDTIKQHLRDLYTPNICLDHLPPDAVLDTGHFATMKRSARNTTPVPRSSFFGEVIHIDIVFGPEVALGNIHYGLIFSDRFSRMNYVYPLHNLTSDIPKQLEAFFAHIGCTPRRLISDFDLKLIGGKAREYLNSLLIHVNAAPSSRQDKNGLAERHWQTILAMARNWLASAELPASFWFYAVRRAAEVCNYFPYKLETGTYTTPFELVHKAKPDLRVLFPMFGLAAVRRDRIGDTTLNKFEPQSTFMIAVGRCQQSNGLQFYNPANGTFVSSIDYKFQLHSTSGAHFNYKYQPGVFIYRLDETTAIFTPKFTLDSDVLVHTHSPPSRAKIIGIPSYDRPDIYTVLFADGTIAEYSDNNNILEAAPTTVSSSQIQSSFPAWIQSGANATLFLSHMTKPRHGKLLHTENNEWFFCPGHNLDIDKGILLSDFSANCQELLDTGQIFRGHTKFKRVYHTRHQLHLRDSVLRHVSAHGLSSLIAPSSLSAHQRMSTTDQQIWNAAYDEEFDGLASLPTWEVLTEDQYRKLGVGVKALPSMAIATIKYDSFNQPKRAKYRIVVLGNHDYHSWSKSSTAAPVMSQLELHLLTSLAISQRRVLKNCDIKQAFVQSSLPDDEVYYVKPPKGCPRSAPGTYWRLLRSLYGLRRAPKLWFDRLSSFLKSLGLKQSSTSPCIFFGSLTEGGPPIYVGIYVDDIIYFSSSDEVERKFESCLTGVGEVDFMGQVSYFLGIEFTWKRLPDNHLCVSLTQQSFIESLLENLNISFEGISLYTSPYRSGLPVDSIPSVDMTSKDRDQLRLKYQSLVGSLNWLAHTTRPDLSTIVSLLAQHQSCPSLGHYDAALYVAKYLATTKHLGLYFTSLRSSTIESFLHFPLTQPLLPMSDANWGPQDATMKSTEDLPLFVSRSMSAFYVDLFGPLHWLSKRQSITAGSSAEAEIYATDECVKFLLELHQLLEFLELKDIFMPGTTVIYNDNRACVNWSKTCTTKGLRHIQMKENRVRENVQNQFVAIHHVEGKVNLADLFTKEMKDTGHFVELRDIMLSPRLST